MTNRNIAKKNQKNYKMNVAKLLQGKGFKGFKTSLNAKPYPLRKCPNMPNFGHFPCEKCFKANFFRTKTDREVPIYPCIFE
jgi:hypothetical protein